METRANHILVGSFVVLMALITLGSLLWLGKFGDEQDTARFDILFAESVIGLSKGSLVSYNGVPVGEVESLRVDPNNLSRVLVRVRIKGIDLVRTDTEATLGFAAVTGVADIRLEGGSLKSPPLYDPETIRTLVASPSTLAKLAASGKDIMSSINEVAARLTDMLSEENITHVNTVLSNVDALTTSMAAEREALAQAMRQLADVATQAKHTLASIDEAAQSVQTLMSGDARELLASTQATMQKLDALSLQLDALVKENRGAIAGFTQQGLREVGPALEELRATLATVQQLSNQLSRSSSPLLANPQPREFKP
jgi:phospholipid/cholesterol/gamma-HCH transport system substrate-binding protein